MAKPVEMGAMGLADETLAAVAKGPAKDWREVKKALDLEKKKMWLEEPVAVKRLAEGILRYNPGHHHQYWTIYLMTWAIFLAHMQWIPRPIYAALKDPTFTLDHVKRLVLSTAGLGRYYYAQNLGDDKVMDLTWDVCLALPTVKTKEELAELMLSFFGYMGRYYFWLYHRMPSIGAHVLRTKDKNFMDRLNKLAEGAYKV